MDCGWIPFPIWGGNIRADAGWSIWMHAQLSPQAMDILLRLNILDCLVGVALCGDNTTD